MVLLLMLYCIIQTRPNLCSIRLSCNDGCLLTKTSIISSYVTLPEHQKSHTVLLNHPGLTVWMSNNWRFSNSPHIFRAHVSSCIQFEYHFTRKTGTMCAIGSSVILLNMPSGHLTSLFKARTLAISLLHHLWDLSNTRKRDNPLSTCRWSWDWAAPGPWSPLCLPPSLITGSLGPTWALTKP